MTALSLPDLLHDGLDIVFIGINPGLYSAQQGHYFARKTNRFWPAFSASRLSQPARQSLGLDRLGPEHDETLLAHGIGFTDVVKRATANAGELDMAEFVAGVPILLQKLQRFAPRFACFHGVTSYRPFHDAVFGKSATPIALGLQTERIAETQLFLVPNPSPANAHATPALQADWYDRLAALRDAL